MATRRAGESTASGFEAAVRALATEEQRIAYRRYFPGDETFIGVRMGDIFALAKDAIELPVGELETLLDNSTHEVRVGACSIMGKAANARGAGEQRRRELYELCLRRHDRIDTWDLVDLVAHQVLGTWLLDRSRAPLYALARSGFWPERRSAVVATAAFLRRGEVGDALDIAVVLADDTEELVQKATGWMLRCVGEIDRARLLAHLDTHASEMSRAAVRASIEKLDQPTRARYLTRP